MVGKKPYSLRLLVLGWTGFSLAVFTLALCAVFYAGLSKMLLQSESMHLSKQLDVIEGLLGDALHKTCIMAHDIGISEEAALFVRSENPDYTGKNWQGASILQNHQFDFVVFRDLSGEVLYRENFDYAAKRSQPVPEGFVQYLDKISDEVLNMQKTPRDPLSSVENTGKGGIIFYGGAPYLVAVMPIMRSRDAGNPAGTIILGNVLSNEYFRGLTHYETLNFEIVPTRGSGEGRPAGLEHETYDTLSSTLPLRDINGDSLLLRMSDNRTDYPENSDIFARIIAVIMFSALLFGIIAYYVMRRIFLRPLENLERDLDNIAPGGVLNMDKYRNFRELAALCVFVNQMSQRLEGAGISIINSEGAFEYVNQALADTSGYTAEELKRGGVDLLFEPEVVKSVKEELIPLVPGQGKSGFELPLRCKDGQVRDMFFSTFKTGFRAASIGVIALEITEKKFPEQDFPEARKQAGQSSPTRSKFLSRMSREMCTQINTIIDMSNIAKTSPDMDKKGYCLSKIDAAANYLLGVLNDILDMEKIESGKFELSRAGFNFEKMLLRLVNMANSRVDDKQQSLIIYVDPEVPAFIVADERRLAQVINNLLDNAVKFTHERGTISVVVSKLDEKGDACTLKVEVSDTGIGIAEDQIGKLFISFEQVDGGMARKFGGIGLGLTISKRIVEMMNGDIWVESKEGKGSSFFFTVRVQKGEEVKRLLKSNVNWKNLRVLVVDAALDVREYFLNLAQAIGFDCEVAADGFEACALAEQHRDRPFNIVFVDWKMPGMGGIELTGRLKKNFGIEMAVAMRSASHWNDIRDEAKAVGVDKFLSKPIFSSLIVDCINECLGLSQIEHATDKETARRELFEANIFVGYQILLAEDIAINQEIISSLLQHTGVSIDIAENGRKAVEMFKADPDRYDMIFMDIHMPEMNGYEAARLIRGLDEAKAKIVPIVALTANVFREDIEKCLVSGMNAHLGKPVSANELMAKMRHFLLGA